MVTAPQTRAQSSRWTRADLGRALALILAVLVVHAPVLRFEFLHYGDVATVTENPQVLRGLDLTSWNSAWTSVERGVYQPLTRISHALDVNLFGTSPHGPHLVNLLLHAANTFLVWLVLRRATGRAGAAWVVALLFGLHPLQVQSMAWVSERQGLLAACFGLLAMDRHLAFVRTHRRRDAIAMHLAFAASLLSKPVLVALPVLLLLAERWPPDPPRSLRMRWRETRGLIALAVLTSVATLALQIRASGLASLDEVGVVPRLANAVVAYARTLRRVFWPDDLAAVHTFSFEIEAWKIALAVLTLFVLVFVAWTTRRRVPIVAMGLSWWVLLQLPTVQLVQFGQESTADRFSYLPVLGIFVAFVYGLPVARWPRGVPIAAALVVLVASALATSQVLPRWRDTLTLFEHNVRVTGGSAPIHLQLSTAHHEAGNASEALAHANRALRYAPNSARVNFAVAELLYELGSYVDAYNAYTRVVLVDGSYVGAYARIGELLLLRGEPEEAGRAFHRGLQVAPDDPRMILGLASVMDALGRPADRLALLQRALAAAPDTPKLRREIAWIAMTQDIDGAPSPESALRLAEIEWQRSGETDLLALEAMAAALARGGRREAAAEASERAEQLAREAGDEELAAQIVARRDAYRD